MPNRQFYALAGAYKRIAALEAATGDLVPPNKFSGSTQSKIQQAIDAASAQGGGIVPLFGPGYSLSGSALSVKDNVSLMLAPWTVLTQDNGANLPCLVMSEGWQSLSTLGGGPGTSHVGTTRARIEGGIFDGNKANNTGTHGIGFFGYRFDIENVAVRNCPGFGIATEWGTASTPTNAEPGSIGGLTGPMESFLNNIRVYGNNRSGLYHNGPNDSVIKNVMGAFNANASQAGGPATPTDPNLWVGVKSLATLIEDWHAWSGGNYGIQLDAAVNAKNCHAEGAYVANVLMNYAGIKWHGGRSFYGHGWANSGYIGFKFGAAGVSAIIRDVHIEGCEVAAFDFTSSNGGSSSIDGCYIFVSQGAAGAIPLYTGSPSTAIQWGALSGSINGDNVMNLLPPSARRTVMSDSRADFAAIGENEDFLNNNTTSGQIGRLGWSKYLTSTATEAPIAGISNGTGQRRLQTGTTSGSVASLALSGTQTLGIFTTNQEQGHIFRFKPAQIDSGTVIRVGLFNDTLGNPPTEGVYLEKAAADTNWFAVMTTGGTPVRADTGIAATTAYNRFRLKWKFVLGFIRWGFYIAGTNTEFEIGPGGPAAGTALGPVFMLANATAANKILDVDYYGFTQVALIR